MKARGKRALLNRPGFGTTAAIVAEVEDTRKWKPGCAADGSPLKKYNLDPEVTLQISDCSRAVSFEFYGWSNPAERRNHLHKVDTLINALSQFRGALADEHDRYVARAEGLVDEE